MAYLFVVVLLNLIILIHEVGHFLAARAVGIPIVGFHVGFGPKLWSRRWWGTEYCLRAPLTLAGLILLAGLMLYANGHDVARFWG